MSNRLADGRLRINQPGSLRGDADPQTSQHTEIMNVPDDRLLEKRREYHIESAVIIDPITQSLCDTIDMTPSVFG